MSVNLEKKKQVKQKKRAPKTVFVRKARLVIFYFSLLFFIVLIGIIFSLTVLFKIDTIEVIGETRYDKNEIVSQCIIKKGENLLITNTKKCKEGIERDFPYIENAEVSRCVPSKIVINVKESNICGYIGINDNRYVIISDKAKVLDVVDTPTEGCALIKGINIKNDHNYQSVSLEDDHVKYIFVEIMRYINKYEIDKITEIDLMNILNLSLTYDGRIKIVLGSNDELDCKMQTAVEIIKNKLNETDKGTLNLSVISEDGHSYFMPEYII